MAQHGARILAIDLSINALHALAGRLVTGRAPTPFPQNVQTMRDFRPRVGLVHADASRIRLAPRSVNRALSTTPLDSREQRMALYSSIADALADDGWFVGSVEHDDLFRRSLGLPTARRYERGGIFIEHFDSANGSVFQESKDLAYSAKGSPRLASASQGRSTRLNDFWQPANTSASW
jgi:hypothetical protein